MTEIRYKTVNSRLRKPHQCAEFLQRSHANQVSPDTVKNDGRTESFLLNGAGLSHPTEGPAEHFANALNIAIVVRERLKKVNRVTALGVPNVIFKMHFHPRHCDDWKVFSCSPLGTTLSQKVVGD